MNIAIASFTKNGKLISEKLQTEFEKQGAKLSVYETEHKAWIAENWKTSELIIYIGATGIAVRYIAPHIHDKMTDPAVLVVDEKENFCISLISGHIGGGNEWARKVAEILGAIPVITTATDLNDVFAVDIFAKKNDLQIGERVLAKEISAKILGGEIIPIVSEVLIEGKLPKDLRNYEPTEIENDRNYRDKADNCKGDEIDNDNELGIYVGVFNKSPFKRTLHLIPKVVCVGIGCRKGIEKKQIQDLVEVGTTELQKYAINSISSIDLKADEKGLLEFCEEERIDFKTYTASDLEMLEGEFSESVFVKEITGVSNVCERSAVKTSGNNELYLKKTSQNSATIAISMKKWSVRYE